MGMGMGMNMGMGMGMGTNIPNNSIPPPGLFSTNTGFAAGPGPNLIESF